MRIPLASHAGATTPNAASPAIRLPRMRRRATQGPRRGSAGLVLSDTPARGRAARALLPRRARAAATVVTLDELATSLDTLPPRHAHVVVAAASEAALGRLLPLASGAGAAAVVTLALLDAAAPPAHAATLRRPLPSLRLAREESVRAGRLLHLHADGLLEVRHAVAATLPSDALARGWGAGGLQTAVTGAAGLPWAFGDARAVTAGGASLGNLHGRAGRHLDVLVVDDADEAADALAGEAAALGAAVLHVESSTGALRRLVPAGPVAPPPAASLPAAARQWTLAREREAEPAPLRPAVPVPRALALPPVDLAVCNPIGFREAEEAAYAAVPTLSPLPLADEGADARSAGAPVPSVRLPRQGPLGSADVAALRPLRGVIDRACDHAGPAGRARRIAELTAAGVPTVARDLDEATRALLGGDLADLVDVDPTRLAGSVAREQTSIAQRRASLERHGPEARWADLRVAAGIPPRRPRTVSVLLATNRPDHLAHAATQLAGQDHAHVEVVGVLHGEAFDDAAAALLPRALDVPVTVLRRPARASLGECLAAATEAASGELLAKMDDDDWYGPSHLRDLELAWVYSGAELVGKAAEFVHLAELDVTIRRFAGGAETFNDRLGGGALLISRDDLAAAGGWRRARRAVDRLLIADVRAAGGQVYRTHGYGFALTRRGAETHTWDADVGYFLKQSSLQRRGLDRELADLA